MLFVLFLLTIVFNLCILGKFIKFIFHITDLVFQCNSLLHYLHWKFYFCYYIFSFLVKLHYLTRFPVSNLSGSLFLIFWTCFKGDINYDILLRMLNIFLKFFLLQISCKDRSEGEKKHFAFLVWAAYLNLAYIMSAILLFTSRFLLCLSPISPSWGQGWLVEQNIGIIIKSEPHRSTSNQIYGTLYYVWSIGRARMSIELAILNMVVRESLTVKGLSKQTLIGGEGGSHIRQRR